MTVLSCSKISKFYDGVKVIDAVSFSLNKGDKLALIGSNGSGKTTILKLIAGVENLDEGEVYIAKNNSLKYVDQKDDIDVSQSIENFCLSSYSHLVKAESEIRDMESSMEVLDHESPEFENLLYVYTEKTEKFKENGGYVYKSKVNGILKGLGFLNDDVKKEISSISGGQLGRLKLAKALMDEPDILLMDEPTNHLDIKAVEWLENYLRQYNGTLLIVSHDRFFIDRVAGKCMELSSGSYMVFDGNYTEFKIKKERALKARFKEYEKKLKERKRQEEIIKRFKGRGTELLAKRAKSREKMLERMGDMEDPTEKNSQMKLQFSKAHNSGKLVLDVENLGKAYDDNVVLYNASMKLYAGEKIGLIGANGSGKTTFLKILMGKISVYDGSFEMGYRVKPAYYDQRLILESETNTILEEMRDFAPSLDDTEIRTLMGRFLFSGEDIFKPINALSGGERARVLLSKLFLKKANLLLLDEPTNHLDIYSKDVLEDALRGYDGSVLVVSHDRFFLDRVCDKIIELEGGSMKLYHGNYSYYLEKKQEEESPLDFGNKTKNDVKIFSGKQASKLRKKKEKLEQKLEEISKSIEDLDFELYLPEVYTDKDVFEQKTLEKEALLSEQEALLDEYLTLEEMASN